MARFAASLSLAALPALASAADPVRPVAAERPASGMAAPQGRLDNEVFRGGEGGFVVSDIAYGVGPDAKDGACPAGMTGGVRGLIAALAKTPEGARKEGEETPAYERRMIQAVNTLPDGKNICMNPELAAPDPGWRLVSGRNLKVEGIDLDGRDPVTGRKQAGTCAHEEFTGKNGERGIDNQFYRVIGCTTGFQSDGSGNTYAIEMLTGSWGILIRLTGVDDLRNDPDVEVGFFANGEPIQLSAARAPLPFATYAVDKDARYRAVTRGRIVDGVLTVDPIDVRFHNIVNSMFDDRVLRAARVRLTFTADGGMEGYLAGYTPIESAYDLGYGSRHSRTAKGELAPERLRVGTSVGRAGALGHSCNGAYYALREAADGDRDPATGRCTSISTQYRIRLLPAFILGGEKSAPPSLTQR